jgi:chitodextrinase
MRHTVLQHAAAEGDRRMFQQHGGRGPVGIVAVLTILAMLVALLGVTPEALAAAPDGISGRVVESDGTPVGGATVRATAQDPGDGSAPVETTTEADGAYALALSPGRWTVIASPPPANPDHVIAATRRFFIEAGHPLTRNLTLSIANVRGTVTDSTGAPAAGATVDVLADNGAPEPGASATAAADGSYLLVAPSGRGRSIVAHPPASNAAHEVPGTLTDRTIPAAPAALVADVRLRLPNVTGTVTALDGSTAVAVAGATITATDLANNGIPAGARIASASDGWYGLLLPAGTYDIRASAPAPNIAGWGQAAVRTTVPPDGQVTGIDVQLSTPNLSGHVVGPDGTGVAGAVVHVSGAAGACCSDIFDNVATADSTGSYRIAAPGGNYTSFHAEAPDHSQALLPFDEIRSDFGGGNVTKDLPLGRPTMAGRVRAPGSGEVIEGASVDAIDQYGDPAAGLVSASTTDLTGFYSLGLDPGATILRATPPAGSGWIRSSVDATSSAAESTTITDLALRVAPGVGHRVEELAAPPLEGWDANGIQDAAISGDGQVAVLNVSYSAPLPGGPTCSECPSRTFTSRTWRIDLGTHVVSVALPQPDGTPFTGAVRGLVLSADGGAMAFTTNVDGAVATDADRQEDAFVRDLGAGTTEQVSDDADPNVRVWDGAVSISADGSTVAFVEERYDRDQDPSRSYAPVVAVRGGERRVGVSEPAVGQPRLSGDGSTLTYLGYDAAVPAVQARVVDLGSQGMSPTASYVVEDGEAARYLDTSDLDELSPAAVSADGRRVAYLSYAEVLKPYGDNSFGYVGARGTVNVVDRNTGTQSTVDPFAGSYRSILGPQHLELTSDGSGVTFTAKVLDFDPVAQDHLQVWHAALTGGAPELVSRTAPDVAFAQDVELDAGSGAFAGTALLRTTDGRAYLGLPAETQRPTWPAGGSLSVSDVGTSLLRLRWPAAVDNVDVTGYHVYRDGQLAGATAAATRELLVTGLDPDTAYAFRVEAVDAAGNESTTGPSITARTNAASAPVALLATPAAGGRVGLRWDPILDAGVDHLVVTRAIGSGAAVDVASLAPTASTFDDSGLAAAATYAYRIVTVDGSGARRVRSVEATATTPALTLGSFSWSVPIAAGAPLPLGGVAALSLRGEPGREAAATIQYLSWYDGDTMLDAPRTATAVVPLTEDPALPGAYRGTFTAVEGVARILGASGTITDGQGSTLTATATRPAVEVAGAVRAAITTADDLSGHRLIASSAATLYSGTFDLFGQGVVELGSVAPATDLDLRVVDATGFEAAAASGVVVRAGRTTIVALAPRVRSTLTGILRDAAGAPLAGWPVNLLEATDRRYLQLVITDRTGRARFAPVPAHTSVLVEPLAPTTSDLVSTSTPTTLAPGDHDLPITLTPPTRGTITGTVRRDGAPQGAASVTLLHEAAGRSRSDNVSTAPDGTFTISGYAGAGTLQISYEDANVAPLDVTIPAGGSTSVGVIDLPAIVSHRLPFVLQVRTSTSEPFTVVSPIDGRTAYHYYPQLTGSSAWSLTADEAGNPVIAVDGRDGTVIHLCLNGSEGGYGYACGTAVLDSAHEPTLTVTLGPGPHVHAPVVNEGGTPLYAEGILTPVAGTTGLGDSMWSSGGVFDQTIRHGGTFDLDVRTYDGRLTGSTRITVPDDGRVDLPPIVLRARSTFASEVNRVAEMTPIAVPGGTATFRATYRNDSLALVRSAVARIEVPGGASVADGSILLDGVVVAGTAGAGHVDIPVGDVGPGQQGSLRFTLRVPPAGAAEPDAAGTFAAAVTMLADGVADRLRPATIDVAALALEAPEFTGSRSFTASGTAPAGTVVTVLEGGAVVGRATAGTGGRWRAGVTLAQTLGTTLHRLVATAVVGSQPITSRPALVTVDPSRPAPSNVTISQGAAGNDLRSHSFDPSLGIAAFPFVYVPGQELRIETTYADPASVLPPTIRANADGADRGASATGFSARLHPDVPGDIYVDTQPVAAVLAPPPPPTPAAGVAAAASRLPSAFAGFSAQVVSQRDNVGTLALHLPLLGKDLHSSVSATPGSYRPTLQDEEFAARTGAPIYDLSFERVQGDYVVRAKVPLSALGITPPPATASPATGDQLSAKGLEVAPTAVMELAFVLETGAVDGLSAGGAGEKYAKLLGLYDLLNENCDAETKDYFDDLIQNAVDVAFAMDVLSAGMAVGGLFLAPATFGLGTVALWGASYLLGKATDAYVESQYDQLKKEILLHPGCDPDAKKFRSLMAHPTWIYDPSGYVYEGARSRRLGGVTATLLQADSAEGPWRVADMEAFGQENPLTTDDAGQYGWDVPEGWWKVAYSKDGYEPAFSEVMRVLPPHLDVDVNMESIALPALSGVSRLDDGSLSIVFSKPMRAASVAPRLRVDGPTGVVTGTLAPVEAATADDGTSLTDRFRFVPDAPLLPATYTVRTDALVQDYTGRLPEAPLARTLVIAADGYGGPTIPDGGAGGGVPSGGGPSSPTAGVGGVASLSGYRMAAGDGGVFTFGDATFLGSMGGTRLASPVVGMATTPSGQGYWLVAADGGIFTFGDAPFLGSMGGTKLRSPVVGMASTPSGHGYWLAAADGGIFAFGDATFLGSMGGTRLSSPVVGMASTPSGQGYSLVAADGGLFTFGDAAFLGSMGGTRLSSPVVGMASTSSGHGYWMVASDGGIFTFGDAPFLGSTGDLRLNQPIVAFAGTHADGYRLAARDGGVFSFGTASFLGSLGDLRLNAPVAAATG